MSNSQSLKKLVTESGYLRDHLLRVEGQDSASLVSAMQPFDRLDDLEKASDAEITNLAAAFQDAHDKALGSVDGYTLNEVLKGRSPHSYSSSILGSFSLTVLGVVMVMTAFYFSNWASRTTFAISEAKTFVEYDHFNSIMSLVELESYFEEIDGGPDISDMEPQLVYLEGLTSLKAHYHQEELLPAKMLQLIEEVNPIGRKWNRMRVDYCRAKNKTQQAEDANATLTDGARAKLASEGLPSLSIVTRSAGIAFDCTKRAAGSRAGSIGQSEDATQEPRPFRERIAEINQLQRDTMDIAGRRPLNEYVQSYYRVQSQMQTLTEWLNVVYLWGLPIIYGALGSIVYCMWRVLNPNLAAVGGLYAIMRTAFAGLAALTLSMLLVPSNILTVGVDLNRPLVYLLSFIFGYSIEAFVSTLNALNTYLSHNLTPKQRSGGKGAKGG